MGKNGANKKHWESLQNRLLLFETPGLKPQIATREVGKTIIENCTSHLSKVYSWELLPFGV